MTANASVTLPFLGKRDYLHGTTLCTEMCRYVPESATIDFRIPRIIRSNCVEIHPATAHADPAVASARLNWTAPAHSGAFLAFALEPDLPVIRTDYDEDAVTTRAQIEDDEVRFEGSSSFDLVATVVPLFKALLRANDMAPQGGQWMFTRLQGSHPGGPFSTLRLRLLQARQRLVAKAGVAVDGADRHEIYFSWVADGRTGQR